MYDSGHYSGSMLNAIASVISSPLSVSSLS